MSLIGCGAVGALSPRHLSLPRAGAIAAQEMVLSPEGFAARLRAEHERMGVLVKEIGLRAD